MSLFLITGWETGDTKETTGSSGTVSVQTTIKKTGGYALRVNPTTTGTGYHSLGKIDNSGNSHTNSAVGGANPQVCGFYFYAATLPASGSEEIVTFLSSANAHQASVRITSAGKLQLYNIDATTQAGSDSSTALSTGTWYFIEVSCEASLTPNTHDGKVWINGTLEINTATGDFATTSTNYDYIRLGKSVDRSGQSVDFYYDDFYSSDTQYGASVVERMALDGNGTYTQFTGGTGSSDYTENDEITPDGVTSYAQSTAANDVETYTFESAASAGVSGTIIGVQLNTDATRVGIGTTSSLRLRSATTNDDSTNTNYVTGTYALRGKVFVTDPATASAWTTSGLDGIEGGLLEQSGSTNRIRMSTVWVNVLFTPAAGGGGGGPLFDQSMLTRGVLIKGRLIA